MSKSDFFLKLCWTNSWPGAVTSYHIHFIASSIIAISLALGLEIELNQCPWGKKLACFCLKIKTSAYQHL